MKQRSTRQFAGRQGAPKLLTAMIALALAAPGLSHAQNFVPAGPGTEAGPYFLMNGADNPQPGQPSNTAPYFATQSGAIQSIAVDPSNPNLILASAPSGGIFRSTDGGQSWAAVTDTQGSLAVSNISFDPTDPTGMTLVASIGSTTNGATGTHFDRGGLTNQGLLYSTDGGQSWSTIGQNALPNVSMLNVVARGQTIIAAGFEEEGEKPNGANTGLYRSTDGGKTFLQVNTIAGSGLPPGPTSALVGDPTDPHRFYVGVSGTSDTAVYTSADGGKTWARIFSAANANGAISAGTPTMLRVAAGPHGSVVVGVVNMALGQLNNAFLSQNGGQSWVDLSPSLSADTVSNQPADKAVSAATRQLQRYGEVVANLAINQGGQATTNSLVAIDPNHPNVVYLAGDGRYDNVTGSTFEGVSALRVVVNADGSITYAPLTDNYTSDQSTVHPDARVFAFDGQGNLLMGTDGGIYLRSNPTSNNGVWRGFNNGRQALEIYSLGLDPNTGQLAVAAQDNGSARQLAGNRSVYRQIGGGDGTLALINGQSTPGYSYTYVASQYLGGLTRYTTDAQGNYVNTTPWTDASSNLIENYPLSTDIYFAPDSAGQFYTVAGPGGDSIVELDSNTINFVNPFVLNNVDKSLMATGVMPGVMVSQDNFGAAPTPYVAGDTGCTQGCYQLLPSYFTGTTGFVSTLDFGTQDNTYALLAGTYLYQDPQSGNYARLFLSTGTSLGSINLQPVFAYPVAMRAPNAVLFDPRSENRFFAAAPGRSGNGFLWGTVNGGATGTDLTANLPANFIRPDALGFINSNGVNALLVGGMNSAANAGNPLVAADSNASGNLSGWRRLGNGLPNVQITVIDYQRTLDAMAIGTYGRGAWMLYDVTSNFANATVLQFGLANNDSNPDASLLTGNRPLIKYGTGTLAIVGNATYTGGTTIDNGAVVLNGAVLNNVTVAAAATLAGSGSASGQLNVQGGLVAPGSGSGSGNALTVGSLGNQGGTLLFAYGPTSGNNTHLTVNGHADIGGMNLMLMPLSAVAPSFYSNYNLLSAGSLSGQFANASSTSGTSAWVNLASLQPAASDSKPTPAAVQPNPRARLNYLGSVSLEILSPLNWTAGAGNSNQYAVGQALNSLQYTASGNLLAALNTVASGNLPANLGAISGESSVASARAINLAGDRFLATIGDQMLDAPGCRDGKLDRAGCYRLGRDAGDHRFWAQITSITTRLNGEFQSNRFDGSGLAVGGEIALGERAKAGVALSHSNVATSTPALSSSVRSQYNMLAAYGQYQRGPWFIGGVLSFDSGWSYADRAIRLGAGVQTASGKPNASSTALQLTSGLDFRLAHDWFVQPYADLIAAKSSQDAYAEYGAGALSLQYGKINQTRYQGDLGVKLGTSFGKGTTTFQPYVGLAEAVAWGDRQPGAQVSFTGAPGTSFQIRGNSVPGSWLNGQAGVHMALAKSVLIDVSYQGALTGRLHDDFFNAGLSVRF